MAKVTKKKHIFNLKFTRPPAMILSNYDLTYKDADRTTNIDFQETTTVCYSDESKKVHKCMISTIDFSNPSIYCCFWDRHFFTTQPIGCPIKYVPDVITREYFSEITKDKFSVKESASDLSKITLDTKYEAEYKNYYETDGVFCSFSCCLAFIRDNKKNPIYTDSEHLLRKIYYDFFKSSNIICSPSWRILKEYGGMVNIEEFRNNVSKMDYIYRGTYKSFKSVGNLYEEKIKF